MIFAVSLKKTIFISLLGHIALFSIFSLSFGKRMPHLNYTGVSFLGGLLSSSELLNSQNFHPSDIKKIFIIKKHNTAYYFPALRDSARNLITGSENNWWEKPTANFLFNEDKISFMPNPSPLTIVPYRKESTILFHPLLPYHFTLYFKDRQMVHIELMFNIISTGRKKTIAIKRKISSGNLEADLLSMRYIGNYLSIQEPRFIPNKWQIVKIDLSAKDK